MNTLVYCIEHEEMVAMEEVHLDEGDFCGHVAQFTVLSDGGEVVGTDLDFCEFPLGYAYCPPPTVGPEWIEDVIEQGSNELEIDLDSIEPELETFELNQVLV